MKLRALAAAAACMSTIALAQMAPTYADGMPEPEDGNINPVPSVPGVPAPGVTQPPPIRDTKPAPAPAVQPKPPAAAPVSQPTPAPATAPVSAPAPVSTPAPVSPPAPTTPVPVTPVPAPQQPATLPAKATPPSPAPTTSKVTPAVQQTVMAVEGVEVSFDDKTSTATVTVTGRTRTGGWTNFELRPLQTFAPDQKYMRSYTLVGAPPSGFATQVETSITTTVKIAQLPPDVKTIRVLSATTEMAHTFR